MVLGPSRQYETDSEQEWICPDCGHRTSRHHNTKERPFCDPCDWQHGVFVAMKPVKNGERATL